MTSQPEQQPQADDISIDVVFFTIQPKIPEEADPASALTFTLELKLNDSNTLTREVAVKPSTTMHDMHAYAKHWFRDVLCDPFTKFMFTMPSRPKWQYGLRTQVKNLDTDTLLIRWECTRCPSLQQLQLIVCGMVRRVNAQSNDADENNSEAKPELKDDAEFPAELIKLCAGMCGNFLSVDTWDRSRTDQELKIVEDRCIYPINPQHKRSGRWRTALGTLTVRRGETCMWTLRVHGPEYSEFREDRYPHHNSLVIGIASTDAPTGAQPANKHGLGHAAIAAVAADAFSWACGFPGACGNRKDNGDRRYTHRANVGNLILSCGDTIYLKLDLSGKRGFGGELWIGFMKKNNDHPLLWDPLYQDIDVNKDYQLAVSMRAADGIEIVG